MKCEFGKLQQLYLVLPTIGFDREYKYLVIAWWKWAIFVSKKSMEE